MSGIIIRITLLISHILDIFPALTNENVHGPSQCSINTETFAHSSLQLFILFQIYLTTMNSDFNSRCIPIINTC
jgi:hypothetical protein